MAKIFIKNIPNDAIAEDVVHALSAYGPINNVELKRPKNIRNRNFNSTFGFAEFEEENDAMICISFAIFHPPECLGTTLCILPYKEKKNGYSERKKFKKEYEMLTFPLSNIEIGDWGRHLITRERRNRDFPEQFTFLTEWIYPYYYETPTITFSKIEEALILEGFNLPDDSSKKRRVKISFRSLIGNSRGILLDTKNQRDDVTLYISLKQPPYLYCKASDLVKAEKIGTTSWYQEDMDIWVRTFDWTGIVNIFGRCSVYKLTFRDNLDQLRDVLNNFVIRGVPRPMPQSVVNCIERLNYSRHYFDEICQILPFKICFLLESLISYGKLTLCEIEEGLGERLVELIYGEEREMVTWHALNQISTKYWDPFDKKYQERPVSIFEIALKNFSGNWHPSDPLSNNSRCVWVNHATITPTKIYFDGPNYESSNRILRLYEDKIDRFLRVSFREENLDRLHVNKYESADIINLRIVTILNTGLRLAGRHYEFLAFSSSQLKETSCWFVASDGEFNANFIRAGMGDFSDIKAPSLYAARMGQCFTSSVGTLILNRDQVINIPDIKRNNYDFSDGCGKISMSLAKRAAKRYWGKKPKDKEIPSVFQFRFGGCKGVVAVDPSLEGDVLCIRPSQTKFAAPSSSTLEIVKTVKNPLPGHLNRQIILLLSALGVQDDVFITLQNEMRVDIDSMMINEEKAREIVKRNIGARECSHVMRTILSMIDAGMMRGTVDPFLKALLECKRVFALKSLRYKARILMPNSFLLLGVIDESGVLEEGEIFVQTSTIISEHQTFDSANNIVQRKHKVWTGQAMITRNPCLHPGDIRKVQAVDVSDKLSHLRNCVVFSQKGDRPLPNLLSGGDLDGDEFFVCFDERILINSNEDPMNYDPPDRKIIEDRSVEITDVCEFFKDFMLNDRLGQIGNLHLAFADYNINGIRSKECIELAELHSKAVDFNKTGVPVDESLPSISKYPDFMEHKFKESYQSEKILGRLYRNIKLNKPNSDPLLKYNAKDVVPNEDFMFNGFEDYIGEAIIFRDNYNGEIRNLMKKYRVKTEAEILTAHLLGYKRIDGRKCQDIREVIAGTISHIIHNYRKRFLIGLTQQDTNDSDDTTPFNLYTSIPINDESKAKACAWYHVTYNREEYPDRGGKTCLLSFPWVVADVLLAIRMDKHLEKMSNLIRDLDVSSLENYINRRDL